MEPSEPKMGPMVKALAEFFEKRTPLVFYPLFMEPATAGPCWSSAAAPSRSARSSLCLRRKPR